MSAVQQVGATSCGGWGGCVRAVVAASTQSLGSVPRCAASGQEQDAGSSAGQPAA